MTTGDFWQRFCDFMTQQRTEDIEDLQKKQKKSPHELTAKEKQMLKVAKGVLLKSLGSYAIQRIKERNP